MKTKLSGWTKNKIVLILITLVIGLTTEYFEISAFLFPILLISICIWVIISPFKFENNE
jgi:hypothetical protein